MQGWPSSVPPRGQPPPPCSTGTNIGMVPTARLDFIGASGSFTPPPNSPPIIFTGGFVGTVDGHAHAADSRGRRVVASPLRNPRVALAPTNHILQVPAPTRPSGVAVETVQVPLQKSGSAGCLQNSAVPACVNVVIARPGSVERQRPFIPASSSRAVVAPIAADGAVPRPSSVERQHCSVPASSSRAVAAPVVSDGAFPMFAPNSVEWQHCSVPASSSRAVAAPAVADGSIPTFAFAAPWSLVGPPHSVVSGARTSSSYTALAREDVSAERACGSRLYCNEKARVDGAPPPCSSSIGHSSRIRQSRSSSPSRSDAGAVGKVFNASFAKETPEVSIPAEGSDALARNSVPDSDEKWWLPYSQRASHAGGRDTSLDAKAFGRSMPSKPDNTFRDTRSGRNVAGSRERKSSPANSKTIHDTLYRENEMRQRRLIARVAEKRREEERSLREQFKSARSARPFSQDGFDKWYETKIDQHHHSEQKKQELRELELEQRVNRELAECSFAPKIQGVHQASNSGGGSIGDASIMSSSMPFGESNGNTDVHRQAKSIELVDGSDPNFNGKGLGETGSGESQRDEHVLLDELIAAQALQVEALRQFDVQEEEMTARARREAAEELESMLEDVKTRVQHVEETVEGNALLTGRTAEYMKLNPGLAEEIAVQEARGDLLQAGEAKVRQQAISALQEKVRDTAQRMRLEKLKVAMELTRLQRKYEHIAASRSISMSEHKDFDTGLVDRLKREAWYREAKQSALGILRTEAETAVTRSTSFKRRTRQRGPRER